jgi:precorrin-6B methylase 2
VAATDVTGVAQAHARRGSTDPPDVDEERTMSTAAITEATSDQEAAQREAAMSFEDIMGRVFQLHVAVDTVAAIGARASIASSGAAVDREVVAALDAVLEAAGVPGVDELAPPQQAMLAAATRSLFGQSADLLAHPTREPGWQHTDDDILEGQGRASMAVPGLIKGALPELADMTSFLDVGTGVGWLAVSAAQLWPDARIVGVDIWEPALEHARRNVAASGVADRIELRNQDVTDIPDVDRFDCTWVPTFFLGTDVLSTALETIVTATRPGGHIVLGRFEPPPDATARATIRMRTIRDGGCTLDAAALTDLLERAGCVDVRELERTSPVPLGFVVGRKP